MTALRATLRPGGTTSLDTDARSRNRRGPDADKRRTKMRLVELLFASGLAAEARRVADCNSNYFALTCKNRHRLQILPTFRCRNRLCPYCGAERQRRIFLRFWPFLKSNFKSADPADLVLITLSLKSSFDPLQNQDRRFKAAFRRLRRMKIWKERVSGAICSYEFTLTPSGWHYHAHIIALRRRWYDQADLVQDWRRASQTECAIADIRTISDSMEGLQRLLQYCFKPISVTDWTVVEIEQFQSMKNIKLSDCFGELRGLKLDQEADDSEKPKAPLFVGCPCPECGEPLKKVKLSWRDLDGPVRHQDDWFIRDRASP